MTYERATRFGRSGVTVPAMITPKRALSPERQRVEILLRKHRMNQLDWLINQHAGDKDYFLSVSSWRREKCDLLEQEILTPQRR
jgi:hypothetical protein